MLQEQETSLMVGHTETRTVINQRAVERSERLYDCTPHVGLAEGTKMVMLNDSTQKRCNIAG